MPNAEFAQVTFLHSAFCILHSAFAYDPHPMIHLHNGDSTAATARRALLPGRHVPFRESMIAGPVRADLSPHDFLEERARFLSESSGENLLRVRNDLLDQEKLLDAVRDEEEIVLWFEHDLFCLVHFLYILIRLSKARRLTMIWCPRPLGAMDGEELVNSYMSR